MQYTIREIGESVSELLLAEGIQSNVIGYSYLCRALLLVAEDPSAIRHITKQIYPVIAREMNSSPASVEHSIRYAIRGKGESNTAFIARVAGRIEVKP